MKDRQEILLTGVTGVLGSHVLCQLMRHTDSNIVCIIRAKTTDEGAQRLVEAVKIYDPEFISMEAFRGRVRVVLGDVSKVWLGLSQEDYSNLQHSIDLVIHSAANTNLLKDFKSLEPINLGGTQNILNFLQDARNKNLSYVSSYSIMGDRTFVANFWYKETDFDVGQGFEGFGYQETKFRAEKIVRESTQSGIRWKIFRPGQIYGDSSTGLYPFGNSNVSGFFYDLFRTNVRTGYSMISNWTYDMSPVDYVSRGIVELSSPKHADGQTFHLTNPHIQTYANIIGFFNELGYPIELLPISEYRELLFASAFRYQGRPFHSATTRSFIQWFKSGRFNFLDNGKVDATWTAKILEEKNIFCPKIDRDLIATYIRGGIQSDYFPDPKELAAARAGTNSTQGAQI